MVKRKPIDWETIEKEFKVGQLSIREIARTHGITEGAIRRRSKKGGWKRDLSEKVSREVRSRLVRTGMRTSNVSEKDEIEFAVNRGVVVGEGQRKDIRQAKMAYDTLVGQLNEIINERKTLEAEIIEETKDDVKPHRRNKMMKAISLPSHTGVLRDMSVVLKNLVPLERQAYNLDEPGVSLNDILNALPPEFRQAVRTELGKFI